MRKESITGVLVDAHNARITRVKIPDTLESYYTALDCTTVDIVSRTIGGKRFEIVCDDEGLLKDEPKVSAVDMEGHAMLVGSLFVCNYGGNGELSSLTDADVAHVLAHSCVLRKHGIAILTGVDY